MIIPLGVRIIEFSHFCGLDTGFLRKNPRVKPYLTKRKQFLLYF